MSLQLPIFMDYHSTTPVDPRVLEEMVPYFLTKFGNAASRSHQFGWEAEEAVDYARERIARLIGAADSKEIVLTSGATESDNLAIKGVAEFYRDKGNHIITTVTEHKAVLDTCKRLEKQGFEVTYLVVGKDGRVAPDDVKKAIKDKTILVSVMLANNEIGTVQPLEETGKITRERGVLLHSDAVQGIGKVDFDVQKANVDLASLTAHEIYGPKGIGALYVRRSKPLVRLGAQMDGGGHERGKRTHRFTVVEGEGWVMRVKAVEVGGGGGGTPGSLEPSYVLRALGVGDELAHSSMRFGLGRFNTEEEVDYGADLVVDKVKRLRELSPLWGKHNEGIDLKHVEWLAH